MLTAKNNVTIQSIELGKALKENRERNRLTQKTLAQMLKTGQSVISAYENGIRIPSSKSLDQLFRNDIVSFPELNRLKRLQAEAELNGTTKQKARLKSLS